MRLEKHPEGERREDGDVVYGDAVDGAGDGDAARLFAELNGQRPIGPNSRGDLETTPADHCWSAAEKKLALFCRRAKCSLSIAVLCLCVGAHPPRCPQS
eukprot:2930861-Pyramimonas_sp.AAC.1